MICYNCGKPMDAGSNYCKFCGANKAMNKEIFKEIEKTKMLAQKRNNIRVSFNTLMGIFLVFAIFFTIFSFNTANFVQIILIVFSLCCFLLFFIMLITKAVLLKKLNKKSSL